MVSSTVKDMRLRVKDSFDGREAWGSTRPRCVLSRSLTTKQLSLVLVCSNSHSRLHLHPDRRRRKRHEVFLIIPWRSRSQTKPRNIHQNRSIARPVKPSAVLLLLLLVVSVVANECGYSSRDSGCWCRGFCC